MRAARSRASSACCVCTRSSRARRRDTTASLRRLLRRAGEADFDALVALRRAELERGEASRRSDAEAARQRLRELEQAAARVRRSGALALHRFDLAIRGDEVMRLLGCRPGPQVGRALRFLTECVIEDPSCNTPERLRERLAGWAAGPG